MNKQKKMRKMCEGIPSNCTDRSHRCVSNIDAIASAYSAGRARDNWILNSDEGLRPFEASLVSTYLPFSAKVFTVGCGAGRETFAMLKMGYSSVVSLK